MGFSLSSSITIIVVLLLHFVKGYTSSSKPEFTTQPRSEYYIKTNDNLSLFWKIEYELCSNIWYVEVWAQNKRIFVSRTQTNGSARPEYSVNATEDCENGTKIVNLTLTIDVSDHILENVQIVYCRIRFNGTDAFNSTIVNFLKEPPTSVDVSSATSVDDSSTPQTTTCPPTETTPSSGAGTQSLNRLSLLCIMQYSFVFFFNLIIRFSANWS